MSWDDTLNEQISKLELIASWASIVNYGNCRDHVRMAIADLKGIQEHRAEQLKMCKEIDDRKAFKLKEEIAKLTKELNELDKLQ